VQSIEELNYYLGKIAMANPELAPFGRASQQVLSALATWPVKKNNVVVANNVLQVTHMLHSGAVNLGLVSASQVRNVPEQHLWMVPEELFSPIDQQMVILSKAKSEGPHMLLVKSFYHFILSSNGQQIIADNGYKVSINSPDINEFADD
jgi:molybdate transport system substrate-binding protein